MKKLWLFLNGKMKNHFELLSEDLLKCLIKHRKRWIH